MLSITLIFSSVAKSPRPSVTNCSTNSTSSRRVPSSSLPQSCKNASDAKICLLRTSSFPLRQESNQIPISSSWGTEKSVQHLRSKQPKPDSAQFVSADFEISQNCLPSSIFRLYLFSLRVTNRGVSS